MRRQRRAREEQEKRKRENRRPILMKLCAALLRLFRGQHSEKMKRSARGNWDPSGRPTAISTQPKRGRGPHHHVEAADDWLNILRLQPEFFFVCFSTNTDFFAQFG